jgi:quercetin dioxygenase-like cupin family protein
MSCSVALRAGRPAAPKPATNDWFEVSHGEYARILVHSDQVDGCYMLSEHVIAPHSAPPTHCRLQAEYIQIFEGVVTLVIGDESREATPGEVFEVPNGMPHSWANLTDNTVRVRVLHLPGGLDEFVSGLLGPGQPEMAALAESFGIELLQ